MTTRAPMRSLLEQLEGPPLVFKQGCATVRNPPDWPCKRQRNCWIHAYDTHGRPWPHREVPSAKMATMAGALSYVEACGTVSISMINVYPDYQRRGLARELMRRMLEREGVAWPDVELGAVKPDGRKLVAALDREWGGHP